MQQNVVKCYLNVRHPSSPRLMHKWPGMKTSSATASMALAGFKRWGSLQLCGGANGSATRLTVLFLRCTETSKLGSFKFQTPWLGGESSNITKTSLVFVWETLRKPSAARSSTGQTLEAAETRWKVWWSGCPFPLALWCWTICDLILLLLYRNVMYPLKILVQSVLDVFMFSSLIVGVLLYRRMRMRW